MVKMIKFAAHLKEVSQLCCVVAYHLYKKYKLKRAYISCLEQLYESSFLFRFIAKLRQRRKSEIFFLSLLIFILVSS